MEDPKHRFKSRTQGQIDTMPKDARRRLSRIVHDHKGNATVEWYDAPDGHERQVFEIEGARQPATPSQRGLNTGSLTVETQDTHNPYGRIPEGRVPEGAQKRAAGERTDLRKLSAWIKMMRAMEEAKKRDRDEE
jgi:hypothetical protein